MMIIKLCLRCRGRFTTELRYIKRGHGKYCSRRCSARSQPKKHHKPNFTCALCTNRFYRRPSRLKHTKSGLLFCSRSCKDTAQKIGGIKDIQPPHYNNGNSEHGYRRKTLRHRKHICAACGYRRSVKVLTAHHIDWDRDNNSIDNLCLLCPTCHREIHAKLRSRRPPFRYLGGP
jgi:HNH endonuclease